jgi:hypothetical protein
LHEKKVEELMFVGLRKRSVAMTDIVEMTQLILEALDSQVLFPQGAAHQYPCPGLKAGICLAQKSASDVTVQCPLLGKVEYGGFCGVHKAQKHKFNPIHTKNRKWAEMKSNGCGFFLLDPRWSDKVLDLLFVMDTFA